MTLGRGIVLRAALLAYSILPLAAAAGQAFSQTDEVLTQHNDNARTGANLRETMLTPGNVNVRQFGMIFKRAVDDQIYSQPLVARAIPMGGGRHDVVYVTTVNNSVYAFDANDADHAQPLWHVNFGAPPDLHDGDFGCTDINGNMGIIGTPVMDPAKSALYVVALTKARQGFEQRLHALDPATGSDLPNSPIAIVAPGFDPLLQNQRPALLLVGGLLYIGYASHCDKGPYHGFLLAYDAQTLKQTAVLNTSPGGEGASIWQSGQGPAADEKGNVYVVTGNGSWNGTTQFSESFLKLDPQLSIQDWFTPSNHEQLDKDDNDLNSSGVTLLPGGLVAGGGKEGVLYTLNAGKFGHLGDEHAIQRFQATGSHLHSIVYWKSAKRGDLLYLWGQRDQARVYRLEADAGPGQKFRLIDEKPVMTRPERNEGHPGAMLSLSANGGKEGILWAAIHATGDSWHESRPGILHAYDADEIGRELWNSLQNPSRDDCGNYAKMAPPTVANGRVYLPSFGRENTGSGQLCVYGLLADGAPPAAPTKVAAKVEGRFVRISWETVPKATSYSLEMRQNGVFRTIASGIVGADYRDATAEKGTAEYAVTAVSANGKSVRSTVASVTVGEAPAPRMVH